MVSALSLQLSFTLEECRDYSPHIICNVWLCIYPVFVCFSMISISTDTSATNANYGLPKWLSGKESSRQCKRHEFDPGVGKIPWKRKWQLSSIFLPGNSHRQRNLAGYSPWGLKRVRHNLGTEQQARLKIVFTSWLWKTYIPWQNF